MKKYAAATVIALVACFLICFLIGSGTCTKYKWFLDVLAAISGPAVAVFAFFGLRQIELTKEIAWKNERRRLFELTIEQCSFYEKVCDGFISITNSMEEAKVEYFDKCSFQYADGEVKDFKLCDDDEEIEKAQKFFPDLLRLFNKSNVYAVAMVTGIANEEVAYLTDGKAFCELFEKYFPVICFCCLEKKKESSEYEFDKSGWNHTFELYHIWRERLEKDKIKKELSSLDEKRSEIKRKLDGKTKK